MKTPGKFHNNFLARKNFYFNKHEFESFVLSKNIWTYFFAI